MSNGLVAGLDLLIIRELMTGDDSLGCHGVVNNTNAADRIEPTVKKVLAQGFRTGNIIGSRMRTVGMSEMGDAGLAALQ